MRCLKGSIFLSCLFLIGVNGILIILEWNSIYSFEEILYIINLYNIFIIYSYILCFKRNKRLIYQECRRDSALNRMRFLTYEIYRSYISVEFLFFSFTLLLYIYRIYFRVDPQLFIAFIFLFYLQMLFLLSLIFLIKHSVKTVTKYLMDLTVIILFLGLIIKNSDLFFTESHMLKQGMNFFSPFPGIFYLPLFDVFKECRLLIIAYMLLFIILYIIFFYTCLKR